MKKYKIRYDRIFAVLLIIAVPVILMLVSRCSGETTDSVSVAVQTEISAKSTSSTTEAVTENIITTVTAAIPRIEQPECKASALYSVDEKRIIYNDTIDMKVAPASLTKLLTASVALKYADKDKVFTVGSEQWLVQPYSSLCYLQTGNMITLEDLITGMLMASGNDAAYTIAVSVARELRPDIYMTDDEAVRYFCELMNDFAYSLGMTQSHFVNPDGWDNAEQYTTVSDLIKITEYSLSVPEIMEAAGAYQKSIQIYSGEIFTWTNSNQLLDPSSAYYCENAVGMKTGTTENAGSNLIALFRINEKNYISVVTGCQSDSDRYELTLKILENSGVDSGVRSDNDGSSASQLP